MGPWSLRPSRGMFAVMRRLPSRGVERRPLGPDAEVRIIGPSVRDACARPGLLWIHGGGYVVGTARHDDALCRRISEAAGCVVVSVEYRLAPDHPYPAPLDDCRAALDLLRSLPGVDSDAITVAGMSAGGGLAAQLVHRVLAEGGPVPAKQVLVYPMLDPSTRSAAAEPDGLRLWDARSNRFGWDSYLAGGGDFVSVLDSVTAELPRTWIGIGTADLFHDESVRYARLLRDAGVETELVEVQDGFHGFDILAPWTRASKAFSRALVGAIADVRTG